MIMVGGVEHTSAVTTGAHNLRLRRIHVAIRSLLLFTFLIRPEGMQVQNSNTINSSPKALTGIFQPLLLTADRHIFLQ